ncbi:uncharacterized protein SCHCODRAFT_02328338 [Schizophyllum commune H4-8]|uniref:uncharacterized protein n=1 Tax=Schizophyllum commune (strain H4-8 / FGSC 9210) TaxID=578458 RepID=UPI00215E99D8|nr:uncharacterized protein SCHCODRAFT_02328338 [Schizophyllum commune H4-8]KAI5891760.1 hypothetical protein SCHCODRAFT_02328338 [Schizophyllum commune H4-8]
MSRSVPCNSELVLEVLGDLENGCLACESCGRRTKYADERERLIAPDIQPPPLAVSQPALQPAMNIPPQAAIS